jgi:HPt (histidine-containing phosphotransfer) domain-containing protein
MPKTKEPETEAQESKGRTHGPRVNLPELLTRVGDDRELLRELLSILKADFPGHLQALREGVARKDLKQVMFVSHTLRGMLSNLAVTKAAASAAQLEHLAGEGREVPLKKALAEFEREVDGLLPEMETYMAEAKS